MKRIYLSAPDVGDKEKSLLLKAFDSNWIAPFGPAITKFEEEFCNKIGLSHACATNSGTSALHLALLALNIGRGDVVLVSDLTFIATVNAIKYVGANPVFIDSDESWNMDPKALEEALDKHKPRAIIVVNLYGQSAHMAPIMQLSEFHNVPVIEDAAESLGATYQSKQSGSFGLINIFSFNGNKIITTGSGGMVASNRPELIERCRYLANQAKDPVPFYQHSEIGFNYKMPNLAAALGSGQLETLNDRVSKKRYIFDRYKEEFANLPFTFMPETGRATRWLSCFTVNDPTISNENIRLTLEKANIESRQVWKPMHLQPVFKGAECIGGKISEHLFEKGLCLPSGTSMTNEDLERVIGAVKSCYV